MKKSVAAAVIILAVVMWATAQANNRKHIVMRRQVATAAPFSEAVLVGHTLYIGGHIGIDPKTGKPGATPEEEARLLMEAFKRTVEAGGMQMDDLVTVTVYCSDVSHYDAFNSIYRGYFHGDYPARAFIGSGKLLFGARYEMEGLAIKHE